MGLRKPNEDFFKSVLKIIKADPKECIFIDDLEQNCKGAQAVKINSILFKNPIQLKKELEKFSIELN